MSNYRIEIVWQNVNDELKGELVKFWLQNSNFTEEKARERAPFVAAIARNDEGEIIALETMIPQTVAQLENSFYVARMLADEQYRMQGMAMELMMEVVSYFEQRYNEGHDNEVVGMFIQVHNPELGDHFVKQRVVMPLGLTFIGRNAKGVPLFVRYFFKR